MKSIPSKASSDRKVATLPNIEKLMEVRAPKDFIFVLMEKMVSDLQKPTPSGDFGPLSHPDIDLSGVTKALRNRNLLQLLGATSAFSAQCISETWSCKPDTAFALYQLHTLLKKFPVTGKTCALAAYDTFSSYEEHCRLYNEENWRAIYQLNRKHPDYLGCLDEIREDIRKLMGPTPQMDAIYDGAKHGNGSSIGLTGPGVTSFFKWSVLPYSVSPLAKQRAMLAIMRDPQWIGALDNWYRIENNLPMHAIIDQDKFWSSVLTEVDYCKFSTVPKAAETDRSIGTEPTLNVYLQLGVDRVLRRRLKKRWGIDLNDQSLNQALAMESSVSDKDATIDLKGASDCVALMAAILLLPAGWLDLLLDLRSRNILISKFYTGGSDDEVRPLHKLSAMGNGFTFVIESIIFAACARYSMRKIKSSGNLSVYGDDIVIDKQAVKPLIDVLSLLGFMVNEEKSFVNGPFRESCGVDCLGGIDIRPFFLKLPIHDVRQIWYVSNSLSELESTLPYYWEIDFSITKLWLSRYIPAQFKNCYGPRSESLDTYLFRKNLPRSRDGEVKHMALISTAPNFNNRAKEFFFRKLMYRPRPTSKLFVDEWYRELLCWRNFPALFQRPQDVESCGEVIDTRVSKSAFDVTLREVVKFKLTPCSTWVGYPVGRVRW